MWPFLMFGWQVERRVIRRCSPFLEGVTLKSTTNLATNDWKVVPDIWKSSADKYGDRVALVDPYHEPTSEMTYRQVPVCIPHKAISLKSIPLILFFLFSWFLSKYSLCIFGYWRNEIFLKSQNCVSLYS